MRGTAPVPLPLSSPGLNRWKPFACLLALCSVVALLLALPALSSFATAALPPAPSVPSALQSSNVAGPGELGSPGSPGALGSVGSGPGPLNTPGSVPASLGPIATAIPTGTTYVVTNTNASDAGSLPHAINIANANPGKDTIVFNIPGTGPHTITLPSGLGGVYDPVIIDGATQPGYPISGTGAPVIILDGVDGQRGIYIEGGDTTIQGLCFIRFSVGIGIGIDNDGGNTIQGNYIGTNISGTAALGNGVGVYIANYGEYSQDVPSNTIGGTSPGAGNLISGNLREGILIEEGIPDINRTLLAGSSNEASRVNGRDFTTMSNIIQGNYIGTNISGTAPLSNGSTGVSITDSSYNTIGGSAPGAGNLISGNSSSGIGLDGSRAMSNTIQGNYIGTDIYGTAALGNGTNGAGVFINAPYSTVGGSAPGAGNLISGNDADGINVFSGTTTIQGNYIGTNISGTAALGNGAKGANIASSVNRIGGTQPGAGNLISGNGDAGIKLFPYPPEVISNTIQGNYIGTDISGTADLGNATDGVIIVGSVNDIVGGTQPGAGNLISGNGGAGIFLLTYGAATIQGNHIGTNISGTAPLGNGSNGVVLADCADCVIGAQTTGGAGGNTIAYNGAVGIAVGEGNTGNSFLSNSIHSNGPLNATTGYSLGLGIDLVELGADGDILGVTPNDTEDPDTGANDLQNYPVITSTNNNTRIVVGTLNSRPLMTYTIEIFSNSQCDTSGYGEGQTYLGSATAVTGADGNALWASGPLAGYTPGEYLTTTATDEEGSTSEFSACYLVPANNTPTSTSTQTSTGTPTKSPTQVATTTATATASTAAGTSTSTANTATPTVCSVSFSDQHPGSSTFYSYVQCLACRGVITGYPDGTFREGSPITRGQIAKVVSNAAGFDEDPGKQIYSDVPPGSTYYEYINRLTRRGIVSGYPCPQRPGSGEGEGQGGAECTPETPSLFKPNENATRGQLSKIVSNAAGFNEAVSGQHYADVPPTGEGSQFYEWVMRLTSRGVMGGYPCGTSDPRSGPCDGQNRPYFRPANEVTRGQAAKIAANTFFPNCVTPARK